MSVITNNYYTIFDRVLLGILENDSDAMILVSSNAKVNTLYIN
jgi:hypothetical protein